MTTILVTGAAGDIGGAVAELLAERGHSLALADHPRSADRLEETSRRCLRSGPSPRSVAFDVTDERACSEAIDTLGPIAGLVNSAGYQGVFTSVERYPTDDARRVLEVNVLGVMNVLAAASRVMIATGERGAVVNVASMAGVSGAPNMPAYSASKAAVIGLTKAAAKDLAPHRIRVNAVSPAFIGPGQMWDNQVASQAEAGSQYFASDPAEVAGQMIAMVPMRRYGSPMEVAEVVAFLLSDAASYLTGVNVEVAGGSA